MQLLAHRLTLREGVRFRALDPSHLLRIDPQEIVNESTHQALESSSNTCSQSYRYRFRLRPVAC